MAKYTRVHRLLKILTLIQGGEHWTPERLAGVCGVSERTIFRDLNELEAVGTGITFDKAAGGYRVDRDFFLPPVHLTARESMALMVLCEHLAERGQIPFLDQAWKAMTKIQAVLPIDVHEEMTKITDAVVVQTARAAPPDGYGDMYEKIRAAISTRRTLRCTYDSLSGTNDGEVFEFEPFALYFAVRAWYAVGLHGGRGEIRTLKLNRFTGATPTDRPYEIPDSFSLDDVLGNAWRMIRGEPDVDVELLFDPAFAETVGDTRWHKTQQSEEHPDGSLTLRFTVSGLDEIVWWVLSMGPHCRVIKPEALREMVREKAEAIASQYAQPIAHDPGERSS